MNKEKIERLTYVSVPLRNICYYFDPFFIVKPFQKHHTLYIWHIATLVPNCSFRS